MPALNLRSLLVAVVVFGAPALAAAQNPSTAQAQQMLQDPAMLQQLKQRIMTSGMTPDQVRARLRAAGYPENLLDAYLGNGGVADSTATSEDVFSAVQELGIADSTDIDLLRCGLNPDSLMYADTLFNVSRRNISRDTTSGSLQNPGSIFGGTNPQPMSGQNGRGLGQNQAQNLNQFTSDSIRNSRQRQLLARACRARADSLHRPDVISQMQRDSGFTIFGLDFFRRSTTLFNPNMAGPVDANYRVGPGDQLVLILTGDVEASYQLPVTRQGFIVVPQVGQIYVNNLTLAQLENLLYDRLGRVYSGVRRGEGATTHFSITPAKLRSNMVYVVGDVMAPGAYQVSASGTLLSALYAAGGPTDNGSLRDLQVRRGGKLVAHMDFYDYLANGDASNDVRLENGDIVFVPVHLARARIVGEIVRPATYEIKPTESLADALRFAGGFKATASRQRVQIERIVPPSQRTPGRDRVTTDIVSDAFLTGTGPAVPVQPGDVIRVFPVATRVRNRIVVRGNVNMPGTIGLTPNMTVSEALQLSGGIKPDTYLGDVLITRLNPDSTRQQLRAVLRDSTGAVINDFQLKEDDQLTVYSVTEFRPTRYVAINGAVRKSGQYPYHEGMTVRDLVLLAGGLEQSALLNEARIARLPTDRTGTVTAREFTVPLDSSYLFERSPNGAYAGPPGLPAPAGPTPDVVLKPYDNVLVLRQPGWELQRTVAVTGEVRFPGKYSLLSKNEHISDIIKRAGGLTPEGYANGVTFYRKSSRIGRIGIELPDVLKDSNSRDNLLLVDGDSLYIPRFNAIVRVEGAVNSPVAVTYQPGKDLNYYIRAAGGPTRKADPDHAYVTQPNGKVDAESQRFLIPDYVPKPQPGSVVFVPENDGTLGTSALTTFSALAGTLSSLVAVLALLRSTH
ncbi:MAG: SLBB domain-containing protein [Gemmatimonadota bacterium]|nr:SLBB domain-containing protein [Gemmatimonadota bacterium]